MSKPKISTAAFLNRFDASVYIYERYELFLDLHGLPDTRKPDFYSILVENTRNPLSLSAIANGFPRGNRGGYGLIEFIRIATRPYYSKQTLNDWFFDKFAPRLI